MNLRNLIDNIKSKGSKQQNEGAASVNNSGGAPNNRVTKLKRQGNKQLSGQLQDLPSHHRTINTEASGRASLNGQAQQNQLTGQHAQTSKGAISSSNNGKALSQIRGLTAPSSQLKSPLQIGCLNIDKNDSMKQLHVSNKNLANPLPMLQRQRPPNQQTPGFTKRQPSTSNSPCKISPAKSIGKDQIKSSASQPQQGKVTQTKTLTRNEVIMSPEKRKNIRTPGKLVAGLNLVKINKSVLDTVRSPIKGAKAVTADVKSCGVESNLSPIRANNSNVSKLNLRDKMEAPAALLTQDELGFPTWIRDQRMSQFRQQQKKQRAKHKLATKNTDDKVKVDAKNDILLKQSKSIILEVQSPSNRNQEINEIIKPVKTIPDTIGRPTKTPMKIESSKTTGKIELAQSPKIIKQDSAKKLGITISNLERKNSDPIVRAIGVELKQSDNLNQQITPSVNQLPQKKTEKTNKSDQKEVNSRKTKKISSQHPSRSHRSKSHHNETNPGKRQDRPSSSSSKKQKSHRNTLRSQRERSRSKDRQKLQRSNDSDDKQNQGHLDNVGKCQISRLGLNKPSRQPKDQENA